MVLSPPYTVILDNLKVQKVVGVREAIDRACLATAKLNEMSALTSDRAWKGLQKSVGGKIELIR
jgi:PIN domain nuclease of toxin-antitoxin system